MKVAYFTPVSPQKTGIADYSEREVLPYISKYVDVDVFIDENIKPNNKYLVENFNIYSYKDYEKRKEQYDIPVYHMGNNHFHQFIYKNLIKNPGITVLHDVYLHGFIWSLSIAKRDPERYIEEFEYCYGKRGVDIAKRAIKYGQYIDFEYPLIKRIVDNSIGVICHSEFGIEKVLLEGNTVNVSKINHPLTITDEIKSIANLDEEKIKCSYGLENNNPVITSFGFIGAHKRYTVLLRAYKRFLEMYPNSVLLLVGKDLVGIDDLISDLNLKRSVVKTGYVPFDEISKYMAISDFCVNLRYPTAGETSGSVLRIMAARKPVIVSNVGWFSELPDNCCLKIDVDSYEEDLLLEYMKILASDEDLRETIGKNAQEYVSREHDPRKTARKYYRFIRDILNGNEFVLNKISDGLWEMDIEENNEEIIRYISNKICDIL